jgi:hypothetical protein
VVASDGDAKAHDCFNRYFFRPIITRSIERLPPGARSNRLNQPIISGLSATLALGLLPSSQAAWRPPGPLRTGREAFPSPSSSPSNASLSCEPISHFKYAESRVDHLAVGVMGGALTLPTLVNTLNTVCLGMDGLEKARLFRRGSPDCNIVIVTQNDATVAHEQSRSIDANGFVINLT